jgi:hypothetical protein
MLRTTSFLAAIGNQQISFLSIRVYMGLYREKGYKNKRSNMTDA